MCSTCGCSQEEGSVTIQLMGTQEHVHIGTDGKVPAHHHAHGPGHQHHHLHTYTPPQKPSKTVLQVELDILQKNQLQAERNRGFFEAKNILALNLVSSPGAGKTSLLERTLTDLKGQIPFFVIEGDQQTSNDAARIAATEAPVVQINTGKGCHLDAAMVHHALHQLKPVENSVVAIENIGNLVCPALFDLGERLRIVIFSVPEGEDKPLKYPDMFQSAQLCIINKVDLLPYVPFDLEKAKNYALQVNPHIEFIEVSAGNGRGMNNWYKWLQLQLPH